MIWVYVIKMFVGLLSGVLDTISFPVTILPLGVDVYLSTGMGYFAFVAHAFPPLLIAYTGLMWILTWKVGVFFARFFHVLPKM